MPPRWYIHLAVVMSGAGVLAAEMLGTRLIGPFYGAGLYLWSALIVVALSALSLGYWLGGRAVDRNPSTAIFCALPGAAGLWIGLIPWLLDPALSATGWMGLRGAVLVSSFILFFPPLVLLGMVTPFAVRLRTAGMEMVGRRAGEIYALSTVASVAAAVGSGFILIPALGAARLAFLTGIALVVTALVGASLMKGRAIPAAILIVAAFAAGVSLDPGEKADPEAGLLAIENSPYAEIRVVDANGFRMMLIDGAVHTEVDAETMESHSAYVDVISLADGFYYAPGTMLLVGLGGGSIAKEFALKGWIVEAVEIDPAVTRIARSHFGLEPSDAKVFHMDGRDFLMENETEYELIVLDAFGSSSIPFHLVTEESFALIASRLAPHGVVAVNLIAVGWHSPIVHSLAATMNRVFERVTVLPIAEPPNQLGNLILFASNRELELGEEPPVPMDRFSGDYNRAHAWANRFEVDPAGVRVLTDDRNPVDIWAEQINLEMRKALHQYFGKSGIGW